MPRSRSRWCSRVRRRSCGRVLSDDGQGIEDAEVTTGFANVITDPDGSFSVAAGTGSVNVNVFADGYARRTIELQDLASGQVVDLGDIQLVRAARLSGFILAPGGVTVGGGPILVLENDDGFSERVQTATTGAYNFNGLLPGDYTLTVEPSWAFGPTTRSVTIDSPNVMLDIELVPTGPSTVEGTISGPDGAVEGARVYLIKNDRELLAVSTDANGHYAFPSVPHGDYWMSVDPPVETGLLARWVGGSGEPPPTPPITVDAANEVVDVELEQGIMISGTVRALDGTPLPGVDVVARYLLPDGETSWWGQVAQTSADGTFRITHVDAGDVFLEFRGAGSRPPRSPSGGRHVPHRDRPGDHRPRHPVGCGARSARGGRDGHVAVRRPVLRQRGARVPQLLGRRVADHPVADRREHRGRGDAARALDRGGRRDGRRSKRARRPPSRSSPEA